MANFEFYVLPTTLNFFNDESKKHNQRKQTQEWITKREAVALRVTEPAYNGNEP